MVSAPSACTVVARAENGAEVTLAELANGGQKTFQAISDEVVVSDPSVAVSSFPGTTVPLEGEDGSQVDVATLEEVVRGEVTDLLFDTAGETVVPFGETAGSSIFYKYAVVDGRRVPSGKVTAITLRCRTRALDGLGDRPLFLAVFTNDETPKLLGVSREAVQQTVGGEDTWHFERLFLVAGQAVRFVPLLVPSDASDLDWNALTLFLGGMCMANSEEGEVSEAVNGGTHISKPIIGSWTVARILFNKGDQGAKGDKGDKGEKGEKGEKGDKGEPGETSTEEIEKRVEAAVHGMYKYETTETPAATGNYLTKFFELTQEHVPSGRLGYVELYAQAVPRAEAVTLQLLQKRESGEEFDVLACSSPAVVAAEGATRFRFDEVDVVELAGRSIRVCLVAEASMAWNEGNIVATDLRVSDTPEPDESFLRGDDGSDYYLMPQAVIAIRQVVEGGGGISLPEGNVIDESVALGNGAKSIGSENVAIGRHAQVNGSCSLALGNITNTAGNFSTSIGGYAAYASKNYSISLGSFANNEYSDSALLKVGSEKTSLSVYFYGSNSELASNTAGKPGMAYSIGDKNRQYVSLEALFSVGVSGGVVIPYSENNKNIILGTGSSSFSIDNIVIGLNSSSENASSIILGNNSKMGASSVFFSLAIGNNINVSNVGMAIGAYTNIEGTSSTVIGFGGSTQEDEVVVLSAADYMYNFNPESESYSRTQFYFISAGSELSSKYLDGEAGLGYCVQEGESIVASGCVKMSAICTVTPFEPKNGLPTSASM